MPFNLPSACVAVTRVEDRCARPGAFETDEEARQRVSRERENEQLRLLLAAGIPAKFANATLDSFDHLPAECRQQYAEVVGWLRAGTEQPGAIVAMIGDRGPGKTYMGCARVREKCLAGKSARYSTTLDYFQLIKAEWRPGGNESAVDERFRSAALLVLDEIQERADSLWQNRQLTRLIDHRYANDRPTLLIGNNAPNQTAEDLIATLGDSVADRVNDGGGIIECRWTSLRGRLA